MDGHIPDGALRALSVSRMLKFDVEALTTLSVVGSLVARCRAVAPEKMWEAMVQRSGRGQGVDGPGGQDGQGRLTDLTDGVGRLRHDACSCQGESGESLHI